MEKRRLGSSDLYVSPLTFGGNVFGWTIDEKKSFEVLDAFIGEGFNFIDTADVYSRWFAGNKGGESEMILGNWMRARGNRSQVIIATKVGMDMGDGNKGLSKKHIIKAVEDSLVRLQTEHIDLYQAHTDDGSTPLEETLAAFDSLVQTGKVRAIGASNYSAPRFEEALAISKKNNLQSYQTLQPLYNLYDRAEFETSLEKVALKNHVSVINYYSLASGFLTGKYRTEHDLQKSARGFGVSKYLNDRGLEILAALDEVSKELKATPVQVALAWLLHRPSVTAPIASATSVPQLKELLGGTRLKLTDEMIARLNASSEY